MPKPPLTKFTLKKNDRVRTPYGIGKVVNMNETSVKVSFDDNTFTLVPWSRLSWP
jgi:mechanosensitive ion channel-like protein